MYSRLSGLEVDNSSAVVPDGGNGNGSGSVDADSTSSPGDVISMEQLCVLPPGCLRSLTSSSSSSSTSVASSLLQVHRTRAVATSASRPWLLLWHLYAALIVVVVVWVATITASTASKLLVRLQDPISFYNSYLTDGVATTDTPCYSPNAPCYCSWSSTTGPQCRMPTTGCSLDTVRGGRACACVCFSYR